MPVVNSATFYLWTGDHPEPTESFVPNQGDWQWCMMEAAAWVADEAWGSDPANVSPVIAQLCKALNDTLDDVGRQALVDYLVAAPAGVIDTVDAGLEDDRQLMCTDWLVRTYLPYWFNAAGLTDEADELAALPAIATGTVDVEETIAVIAASGMVARAVSNYAWSDLDWASLPGDGRADHPLTGDFFPELWPSLVADTDHATLLLAQRCSHGAGYDSLGNDDGQAAWEASRRMAKAAAWDLSGVVHTLSWNSTRATPTPWLALTGGSVDEDTIGLAAWAAARDAAFCACTNGTLARQTFDTYEVRFAAWLAYLGADLSENNRDAVAYAAATEAATTILSGVFDDVATSVLTLLGDLCAL